MWEFYAEPVIGPLYTAAVNEYRNSHHEKSLELLLLANKLDPNDTNLLTPQAQAGGRAPHSKE